MLIDSGPQLLSSLGLLLHVIGRQNTLVLQDGKGLHQIKPPVDGGKGIVDFGFHGQRSVN
jgi:hypothetical protein